MFNLLLYIPLTALIAYLVLLVVIVGSTKSRVSKRYLYYILSVIVWSFGAFMMRTGLGPSVLFYNRILVLGFVFVPVTFYHFTIAYTRIQNQKLIVIVSYLYTLLLVAANFLGFIIEDAYLENSTFVYVLGPLAPAVALLSFVLLFVAFVNTALAVKHNKIPFSRVIYIFIGIALVFIGSLFNLIPRIGQYPVDIIFNLINAFLITYSIIKYKFLEVHVITKKRISYSLSTVFISTVFIFMMLLVKNFITKRLGTPDNVLLVFMAFTFAIIFDPLRNITHNFVSRFVQKNILVQAKLVDYFSRNVNTTIEFETLKTQFLDTIREGIHTNNAYLAYQSDFHTYTIIDDDNTENQTLFLHNSHAIITWFKTHTVLTINDIRNHTHFNTMLDKEKNIFETLSIDLIFPMFYHNELKGLVLSGEKRNGESYNLSDITFIQTLMRIATPVFDNAKLYEKARFEAVTDGLTKLFNHRYFYDYLNSLMKKTHIKPFSIAMFDVDLFKFYNDLYGHAAGDQALIEIAESLSKYTDESCHVVRYGGEEFAIILENKVHDEAYQFIDNIRQHIALDFNSKRSKQSFLTVSAGVASFPDHKKNLIELVEAADQAMYKAKESGRNKTILYSKKSNADSNEFLTQNDLIQEQIKEAHLSSIYALAATIDTKDSYTFGHSENVSKLAVSFASYLDFTDKQKDILKNAGLLHDIGKIGIPGEILKKETTLTEDEYLLMKQHVDMSVGIIKHVPSLISSIPTIMNHHERYDGLGYPRGVKGEAIPLEARLLSIVDAFDAMISGRPYKRALSFDEAVEELTKNIGLQFDPKLCQAFIAFTKTKKYRNISLINRAV